MLKDQQKKKKKIAALQIKRVSFSVWKLPAFYFFFSLSLVCLLVF